MNDTNPDDLKNVEQPGDDDPCEICADRDIECAACQQDSAMRTHQFTRAMYGETSELPEEAL